MDYTSKEVLRSDESQIENHEVLSVQLSEYQLALVGGGFGEVICQ